MKLKPYKTTDSAARKYVRFANGQVITFPKSKVHKVMASGVNSTPISAGFYTKYGNKVKVFGHSDSLQLKPKSIDAVAIAMK